MRILKTPSLTTKTGQIKCPFCNRELDSFEDQILHMFLSHKDLLPEIVEKEWNPSSRINEVTREISKEDVNRIIEAMRRKIHASS